MAKRRTLTPMEKARRLAKREYPGRSDYQHAMIEGYKAGWNSRSRIAGKQQPQLTYHDVVSSEGHRR